MKSQVEKEYKKLEEVLAEKELKIGLMSTQIDINNITRHIEKNLALDFLENKINDKTLTSSIQKVKRAGRLLNRVAKKTLGRVSEIRGSSLS